MRDDLRIEVHSFRTKVRVPLKYRLLRWWLRWNTRRKFGQAFVDMMDECEAAAERAFLLGQEHDGTT